MKSITRVVCATSAAAMVTRRRSMRSSLSTLCLLPCAAHIDALLRSCFFHPPTHFMLHTLIHFMSSIEDESIATKQQALEKKKACDHCTSLIVLFLFLISPYLFLLSYARTRNSAFQDIEVTAAVGVFVSMVGPQLQGGHRGGTSDPPSLCPLQRPASSQPNQQPVNRALRLEHTHTQSALTEGLFIDCCFSLSHRFDACDPLFPLLSLPTPYVCSACT
jgi:hypothetical protein